LHAHFYTEGLHALFYTEELHARFYKEGLLAFTLRRFEVSVEVCADDRQVDGQHGKHSVFHSRTKACFHHTRKVSMSLTCLMAQLGDPSLV
jgi:hypothetical protein